MSLFAEFHLIQNFAPSNLNRDDTGAPKDAMFGGYRRARVSSQCFKRAVRTWVRESGLISSDMMATRTRQLHRVLETDLQAVGMPDISRFNEIVKLSLKKKGTKADGGSDDQKGSDDDGDALLSYLLFISPNEIKALKLVVAEHASAINTLAAKKKLKSGDVPEPLKEAIRECLSKLKALDVALFGRMLADLPQANQHAACQVAHAISTHRVEREFDYFTAVDDEGAEDETGAGMIGALEFNSATFYRYAALDVHKLVDNLDGDRELALKGIAAFAEAMVRAIPTGKQNTFAAHNPPSFVGVVLRHASPFNLANAFETPVVPARERPLTAASVEALADCEQRVARLYGDARDAWAVLDDTGRWPTGLGTTQSNLPALVTWLRAEVDRRLPPATGA